MVSSSFNKILVAAWASIFYYGVSFADTQFVKIRNHTELIDSYMEYFENQIKEILPPDMEDLGQRRLNPRTPRPLSPGSLIPVFERHDQSWNHPNAQDSIDEITGRNHTMEGLFDQRRRLIASQGVSESERLWALKEALRIIRLDFRVIHGRVVNSLGNNKSISIYLHHFFKHLEERYKFGAERIANDLLTQTPGPVSTGLTSLDRMWFHYEHKRERRRLILEWYLAKIAGLIGSQLDYTHTMDIHLNDGPIPLEITKLRGAMILALSQGDLGRHVSDAEILARAGLMDEDIYSEPEPRPGPRHSACSFLF